MITIIDVLLPDECVLGTGVIGNNAGPALKDQIFIFNFIMYTLAKRVGFEPTRPEDLIA